MIKQSINIGRTEILSSIAYNISSPHNVLKMTTNKKRELDMEY